MTLTDAASGIETQVELLRPADWFDPVSVGDQVRLAFYDIGLVGEAQVLKISPCPTPEAGRGRLVLSTMSHKAGNVLELKLAGMNQAIGVTDTHRIFSEDRNAFVPAGELAPGERVRTQDGWALVESINRHRQVEEVYNLEVETEHVYFVSAFSVLVHNDCPAALSGDTAGDRAGKPFTRSGKKEVIKANADAHGGQTTCENCGTKTVPAQQSQKGVTPPKNETHVDHKYPQSKGGQGVPANGQVLCGECNIKKSNKVGH